MIIKKERLFLLICTISISFFATGVYAQTDISTIDENAELQETEGITPDSAFYFIDNFFDRFVDEEHPYDCTLLNCFEGFYCDPYSGCISFEEPEPTKETTTEEILIEGITGGVIGVNTEFFSNNKFLKYFFR